MMSSIIIYTYNNEKNIVNVVATCCRMSTENEVIVVNDNSDDNTDSLLEAVSEYFNFIHLTFNRRVGVGSAIAEGIIHSTKDILVFLDANQANISKESLRRMFHLIYRSACDIVEIYPSNPYYDNDMVLLDSLFRTKALLKKEVFPLIQDLIGINYNLDFFIDLYFRLNRKRIQYFDTVESHLQNCDLENLRVRKKDRNSFQNKMQEYYLTDLELVIKRLKNLFLDHNQYSPFSIYSVQKDLNQRIEELNNSSVLKRSGMKSC